MKRISLFVIFLMITLSCINAQNKTFDSDKLVYGADIGFSISDSYWSLGLSPQVGYKFLPRLHAGAGISYMHGSSRDNYYYNYKNNSYGINLFAYYYPWKKLVAKVRPDLTWTRLTMTIEDDEKTYKASSTHCTPAVVLGAGFHFKPVMILLNYDLVRDDYSSLSDNVFLSLGVMF